MAYSNKVIDHFKNPRNVGTLDKGSKQVGTGLVGAPECGDVMRLQIEVDEQGVIADAKFKTFGCGSAIASSSLATEWLKGKSIEEAASIDNMDIVEVLNQYGFATLAAIGMGYFIYFIYTYITTQVKVKLSEMSTVLIALIDRIRMLDNDLIRLRSKLNTVLTLREIEKSKKDKE